MKKYLSIDAYFADFTDLHFEKLMEMRSIIGECIPDAEEVISYGMPAFKQNRVLVYYAAAKQHLGFYPTGSGVAAFVDELKGYKTSKGAIQFKLTEPLPKELIQKITLFRAEQVKNGSR